MTHHPFLPFLPFSHRRRSRRSGSAAPCPWTTHRDFVGMLDSKDRAACFSTYSVDLPSSKSAIYMKLCKLIAVVAGGFLVAIGGRKLVRPASLRENRRKFSSQPPWVAVYITIHNTYTCKMCHSSIYLSYFIHEVIQLFYRIVSVSSIMESLHQSYSWSVKTSPRAQVLWNLWEALPFLEDCEILISHQYSCYILSECGNSCWFS